MPPQERKKRNTWKTHKPRIAQLLAQYMVPQVCILYYPFVAGTPCSFPLFPHNKSTTKKLVTAKRHLQHTYLYDGASPPSHITQRISNMYIYTYIYISAVNVLRKVRTYVQSH